LFNRKDLIESECKTVRISDGVFEKELFIIMLNDSYFVYENSCPHTGGPLDWVPGQFLNLEKDHIQCSTHYALFRINDGYCVSGACAGQALKRVNVKEVDGAIMIDD